MIDFRSITPDELSAFLRQLRRAFGWDPDGPEELEAIRPIFDLDRTLAGFEAGRMVATAHSFAVPLTVPGRRVVSCAGVSAVSVLATHRRRGLLTEMMRRQLSDLRARGEPVAALWASEGGIYRRFGYGVATYAADMRVRRESSEFRVPVVLSGLRYEEPAAACEEVVRLVESQAPDHPGLVQLSTAWWQLVLSGAWPRRPGELLLVLHDGAGGPDGFAAYRKTARAEDGSGGRLRVECLLAANQRAYAALWRHCLDMDLMEEVLAPDRSPDEPVRQLLEDPRALRLEVGDGLWLRLVDVPRALTARGYRRQGRLRLRVEDEFCPWNTGTYDLEMDGDQATCQATSGEPELVLPVDALGACYLGANRLATLVQAGVVQERRPGAAAFADTMFAGTVEPWCPFHF